jgi:dihydroorotase
MYNILISNANIVNEGKIIKGSLLIKDSKIEAIYKPGEEPKDLSPISFIDATDKYLIPGVIDDQVHFRQPGLTHKGDIHTETMAAVAGGVTTIMEMPNTNPQTTAQELLNEKYELGERFSLCNYSFYIGATNTNLETLLQTDPKTVCGIKIFMGSSTGNMLVDNPQTLEGIFKDSPMLIAVHCEDEATIKANIEAYKNKYGEDIPMKCHADIRNAEACYKSSSMAVEMASKFGTRLHVLHISSAKEMSLFSNKQASKDKKITSEVCVHHLWFNSSDYESYGSRIKWNPSIKSEQDRLGLWEALNDGRIDVIATDHAPHTLEEKKGNYMKAPSGGPLVQHSLMAMIDFHKKGQISLEKIVEKMCHTPADIFKVDNRGYIRPNYYADLVLVDLNDNTPVNKDTILYKCGWSPFEGHTFGSKVVKTIINGKIVYDKGQVIDRYRGMRLTFNR